MWKTQECVTKDPKKTNKWKKKPYRKLFLHFLYNPKVNKESNVLAPLISCSF